MKSVLVHHTSILFKVDIRRTKREKASGEFSKQKKVDISESIQNAERDGKQKESSIEHAASSVAG